MAEPVTEKELWLISRAEIRKWAKSLGVTGVKNMPRARLHKKILRFYQDSNVQVTEEVACG